MTAVKIIAVIASTIYVIMVIGFAVWWLGLDKSMDVYNLNDSGAQRLATTFFFEKLQSIGSISLTLIGVAWAFFVSTGTTLNLSQREDKWLFGIANAYLTTSFLSYFVAYEFLIGRIFLYATIDFAAPVVTFFLWAQFGFFLLGAGVLALTLILCRR